MYITRNINNLYQLNFLDEYMTGHKGFIAGGCFKNIFQKEKIKDIDMFFRNVEEFSEADDYYSNNEDYHFYYQNKRVKAFKHKKSDIAVELIRHIFGTPEEILDQFDFTIVKFAYYKEFEIVIEEDMFDENNDLETEVVNEYKILHHKDFFEHLYLKRLVADNALPYPNSTFERMIKYIKYGFSPCKETKLKIIVAIRENTNENDSLSESLYFGMD